MNISKEKIIEILSEWNFWNKEIDTGIERKDIIENILRYIDKNKVISIVGVRRSGKSTLVRQIAKKLIENGVPKESILIINFEEPQLGVVDLNFLIKIYQSYKEIISPKQRPYIFLDEVQQVYGWERFVRSINEKKEANVIVTGSSSKLLSEELATTLTGRQLYIEVFPFTFIEYLSLHKIDIKQKKNIIFNKTRILQLLREYMNYGGFPEVVLNSQEEFRKRVLISYYEDIINRDVVNRFKINRINDLKSLTHYLVTNISSYFTYNSISKYLHIPVNTVKRFVSYVEIADLVFFVKRFSFSLKEQENSARKVYSIDVGISNIVGFKFSNNYGRIAENIVALRLQYLSKTLLNYEIYYYKDNYGQKEVDFIIKEDKKVVNAIQVCWDISDEKTKKREFLGLIKAMNEFNLKKSLIITEDVETVQYVDGRKIKIIPLWKWLCSSEDFVSDS